MSVVNVTLLANGSKATEKFSDSTTLRQIYEKIGIDYELCTNTIDSAPVRPGMLDMSLRELKCGDNVRMSSVVKADNGVQAVLAGSALVVKSAYKLKDWQNAMKYNPELDLKSEEGESLFKVFIEEGPGSLNENGVVWSEVPDKEGYAIVTILLDPTSEEKEELAKEKLGLPLILLKQMEESLKETLKSAAEFEKEISDIVKTV